MVMVIIQCLCIGDGDDFQVVIASENKLELKGGWLEYPTINEPKESFTGINHQLRVCSKGN